MNNNCTIFDTKDWRCVCVYMLVCNKTDGDVACFKFDEVEEFLNIKSKKTFKRYAKLLEEKGFIKIKKCGKKIYFT